MFENTFIKSLDCTGRIAKWFILQAILYFLIPYLWDYEYGVGTITMMFLYTALYVAYWSFVPKEKRIKWLLIPYLVYLAVVVILYAVFDNWSSSIWFCLLLVFC